MKNKSIIYVNFSPYDNAGRILDFLVENFQVVIHFSFDHLRLKNNRKTNLLTIYQGGKKKKVIKLISFFTPQPLLFPSLPLVALLIITQTFWHTFKLKKKFGKFDIHFTVNAFPAWLGNLLRQFKLVKKTIYWVWDYYPPGYPDWRIRLARRIYWQFDKSALIKTDQLTFPSLRLLQLRKKLGFLPRYGRYLLSPIGTSVKRKKRKVKKKLIIGHLGMLKWEQGLDLLFDNLETLKKQFPCLRIEIIGSGPEENRFRAKTKKFGKIVKFYGFVKSDEKVNQVIQRWTIGWATYVPEKSNQSYWGDPSKIKTYLSQSVPVILTNVPFFAKEIIKEKAGVIINYHRPEELTTAIAEIIKNQKKYSQNAFKLAKRYDYKKLYHRIFAD